MERNRCFWRQFGSICASAPHRINHLRRLDKPCFGRLYQEPGRAAEMMLPLNSYEGLDQHFHGTVLSAVYTRGVHSPECRAHLGQGWFGRVHPNLFGLSANRISRFWR